jgi:hypothetical protein
VERPVPIAVSAAVDVLVAVVERVDVVAAER